MAILIIAVYRIDKGLFPNDSRARNLFLDLLVLLGKWSKFFTRPIYS